MLVSSESGSFLYFVTFCAVILSSIMVQSQDSPARPTTLCTMPCTTTEAGLGFVMMPSIQVSPPAYLQNVSIGSLLATRALLCMMSVSWPIYSAMKISFGMAFSSLKMKLKSAHSICGAFPSHTTA